MTSAWSNPTEDATWRPFPERSPSSSFANFGALWWFVSLDSNGAESGVSRPSPCHCVARSSYMWSSLFVTKVFTVPGYESRFDSSSSSRSLHSLYVLIQFVNNIRELPQYSLVNWQKNNHVREKIRSVSNEPINPIKAETRYISVGCSTN